MDERSALYYRTLMKGILSRIGGWRKRDFLRKWPLSWDLKDKSAWVEEMKVVFNLCKDPEAEGAQRMYPTGAGWWVVRAMGRYCRVLNSRVIWTGLWFQMITLVVGSRIDFKRARLNMGRPTKRLLQWSRREMSIAWIWVLAVEMERR